MFFLSFSKLVTFEVSEDGKKNNLKDSTWPIAGLLLKQCIETVCSPS